LGPLQVAVSSVMTLLVYSLLLFAAFKVVQIATELGEIKELLKDIKRNTEDHSSVGLSAARSPESLIRAVAATTYPPPDYPEVPEVAVASPEQKL
jgi:hypothetical protein